MCNIFNLGSSLPFPLLSLLVPVLQSEGGVGFSWELASQLQVMVLVQVRLESRHKIWWLNK